MKDFIGNELAIDDVVVVTPKNYRGLVKATVIAFTAKQVRVQYLNTWNYGSTGKVEDYLIWPSHVVKI